MSIETELAAKADELRAMGFGEILMWPTFHAWDSGKTFIDWTVFADFGGERHQFKCTKTWDAIIEQARVIARCDAETRELLLSL